MDCTHCKKPAKQICGGCKDCPRLPDDAPIVHYCGAECQKADWGKHKPNCRRLKDRRQLYQVASIAKELFYIFKELTWYIFEITKVDHDPVEQEYFMMFPESNTVETALNLHGNNLEEDGSYNAQYPNAIPFAAHLLPSKQDQEAALSYLGGIQAASWVVEFIKGMLDSIVTKTTAIEHRTKGEKRRTKFRPLQPRSSIFSAFPMAYDGIRPVHTVLKVALRSGENFAIDLAGAQYGHHDPIVPWKEFEQKRILNVISVEAAEQPKGILQVQDYSQGKIDYYHRQHHHVGHVPKMIIDDIMELMNINILYWQKANIGLKTMWTSNQETFLSKQQDLIDYLHWSISCTNAPNAYKTVRGRELRRQPKQEWERVIKS